MTENGQVPIMPAIPPGIRPPGGGGPSAGGNPTAAAPIPGTAPGMSAGQKKDLTDRTGQLDNLDASLKQYEGILGKNGTSMLGMVGIPTAANRTVSSAYTSLLIEMKNLYQLGALSGPDYELMTNSVTDPNSKDGVALGIEGLKEQLRVVKDKLGSARQTLQKQYPGAGGSPAAAAGAAPSPKSAEEYNALAPGSMYHHPDDPPGVLRQKQ